MVVREHKLWEQFDNLVGLCKAKSLICSLRESMLHNGNCDDDDDEKKFGNENNFGDDSLLCYI